MNNYTLKQAQHVKILWLCLLNQNLIAHTHSLLYFNISAAASSHLQDLCVACRFMMLQQVRQLRVLDFKHVFNVVLYRTSVPTWMETDVESLSSVAEESVSTLFHYILTLYKFKVSWRGIYLMSFCFYSNCCTIRQNFKNLRCCRNQEKRH